MSTKIYNAYKYQGKDINTLLGQLKRMKTKVQKEALNIIGRNTNSDLTVHNLVDLLRKELLSRERTPLNMVSSAVVYPYKNNLYIQFFGLDDRVVFGDKVNFINRKLFKDFHYQNQTDDYVNVSKMQWETRRKTWEAILAPSWKPSSSGFTYEFISHHDAVQLAYNFQDRKLGVTK